MSYNNSPKCIFQIFLDNVKKHNVERTDHAANSVVRSSILQEYENYN